MLAFLKVVGGFLLGLIVGAALTLALCLAAADLFHISQMGVLLDAGGRPHRRDLRRDLDGHEAQPEQSLRTTRR
jgi:hypothetical protein